MNLYHGMRARVCDFHSLNQPDLEVIFFSVAFHLTKSKKDAFWRKKRTINWKIPLHSKKIEMVVNPDWTVITMATFHYHQLPFLQLCHFHLIPIVYWRTDWKFLLCSYDIIFYSLKIYFNWFMRNRIYYSRFVNRKLCINQQNNIALQMEKMWKLHLIHRTCF